MAYVIYNIETTRLLRAKSGKEYYATEAAAKSALTRASHPWRKNAVVASDYAIETAREFLTRVEKTEMVRNLMTGKMVEQSVNTPRCCDPSSELYWSM